MRPGHKPTDSLSVPSQERPANHKEHDMEFFEYVCTDPQHGDDEIDMEIVEHHGRTYAECPECGASYLYA